MEKSTLFSQEPEIAVLSIIMRHPETGYSCGNLKPFMFSSIPHSLLFTEISSLIEKELLPDASLVISSLESSKSLQKVGGKEYIDFLLKQPFLRENIGEYISLVVSAYKARKLLELTSSVNEADLSYSTVDMVIEGFKNRLENLTSSFGGDSTIHIGEGVGAVFDSIANRMTSPGIRGYSWGVKQLDFATGGKSPGDYWIISGRPGSGKTAEICNSALSDGRNNIPALIMEAEMPYESLMERFISIDTGIPLQNIRQGLISEENLEDIKNSLTRMKSYPIFIDTNFMTDRYYIESTIAKYVSKNRVKVVYLDYLQLFADRDDNQTHELGRISRALRLSANKYDLCIIAASQLNRGVESRDNKRPIMSDLRQSGNLEEDADYVVGLYRDEYYNKDTQHKGLMEFIILKARNGPVGTLTVKFVPETNLITSVRD